MLIIFLSLTGICKYSEMKKYILQPPKDCEQVAAKQLFELDDFDSYSIENIK